MNLISAETRMMGLPRGCSIRYPWNYDRSRTMWTQSTSVKDWRTDERTELR